MYSAIIPLRHCEAQLRGHTSFIQLSSAASPKQSPCSDFEEKRFFDDCKNSSQLIREGRLLRRLFSAKSLITLSSVDSYTYAPRNNEENSRRDFGRIKENLLEGYAQ
jgi:hypothetical protein